MSSTPNTPTAVTSQSPLQQSASKSSPVEPKSAKKTQATKPLPSSEHTPVKQPLGAGISNTPVPIPRLPGVPPTPPSREPAALPQRQVPNQGQVIERVLPPGSGDSMLPVATQQQPASSAQDGKLPSTDTNPDNVSQAALTTHAVPFLPQDFPDVPGSESMEFMASLLANIRTIAHRDDKP